MIGIALHNPCTCASISCSKERCKTSVSLQVSFYHIGWTDSQLSGQNHEMHRDLLGRECAWAFFISTE